MKQELATAPLRVLLVEDEALLANAQIAALRNRGHVVDHARCAMEALQLPAHDVAVCDVNLPIISGFDLVAALRKRGDDCGVVFSSGAATAEDFRRALQLGAHDFLSKPYPIDDLHVAVEAAAQARERTYACHATFDRRQPATEQGAHDLLIDLTAWLLRRHHGPAARLRAVTACAQLLGATDRAADLGDLHVRARDLDESLQVTIEQPEPSVASSAHDATDQLSSALARARALAEELTVEAQGSRSRAHFVFRFAPTSFQEESDGEHGDVDYLSSEATQRLVLRVQRRVDMDLSATVAPLVGRLLTAAAPSILPGAFPGTLLAGVDR